MLRHRTQVGENRVRPAALAEQGALKGSLHALASPPSNTATSAAATSAAAMSARSLNNAELIARPAAYVASTIAVRLA